MGFHLDEVSCLRELSHAHIDEFINRRIQWRKTIQNRRNNGYRPHSTIMSRRWRDITEKTVEDLHKLTDVLLTTSFKFKLVVSMDQGYVYSNDLLLLEQLESMPELTQKTHTQAVINRDKNTIKRCNSQHAFRSYFKSVKLNSKQKDQLVDFLHHQKEHVRMSPSLTKWIDQPFNTVQDYFFIDYNTPTWVTMLSLVQPGIIRKTMHIVPATK
jgi:hypothetical protein